MLMDMVPILQKISGYTDIGTKKPRCHSRCVCNITIYRYRVLPTSGVFPDIGDDRRPPRAACSTGPEATVQALQVVQPVGPQLCRPKGQCLGFCLHACAQRATAEIALVSGGATYSESLAKLETWNWNYWISSCPFRNSGSRYKRCKILAQSLVGLIIGYTE